LNSVNIIALGAVVYQSLAVSLPVVKI